jgi:hypothetical protein
MKMTEVPHCPECHRRDYVKPRSGYNIHYRCDNPSCENIFYPDDVVDGPWVDMVHDSIFNDPVATTLEAGRIAFADDCTCDYCSRMDAEMFNEMAELTEKNMLEKFCE